MNNRKKNLIYTITKAFLIALLISTFLYFLYSSPWRGYLHPSSLKKIQEKLEEWEQWAPWIFLIGGTLAIGGGVPRSCISFLGGTLFGFWWGILLAEATSLGGSTIVFAYTRGFKKLWQSQWRWKIQKKKWQAIMSHLKEHGFLTVLLLRQMPLPGIVVNVASGLSNIEIRAFLGASLLGFLPQNIVFVLYGSGLQHQFLVRILVSSSLLIILSILGYFIYTYSKLGNALVYLGEENEKL